MPTKHFLFCGTSELSVACLQALLTQFPEHRFTVITRPDSAKGRSKALLPSPVKALALEAGLEVHTPASKQAFSDCVKALTPDIIYVVAYGMIIPQEVVDHYICVNVHPSLLPTLRGPSPIRSALLNGDAQTGVSIIRLNKDMDAGDLLVQLTVNIFPTDNHGVLEKRLTELSTVLLCDVTRQQLLPGTLTPTPQDHSAATYCRKLHTEDAILDPQASSTVNMNKIRAYSPLPGATVLQDGKRIKIIQATLQEGRIVPSLVKPEGKGIMPYSDYCLGNPELNL